MNEAHLHINKIFILFIDTRFLQFYSGVMTHFQLKDSSLSSQISILISIVKCIECCPHNNICKVSYTELSMIVP